jgi:RND family efflux transporter MFP subunit
VNRSGRWCAAQAAAGWLLALTACAVQAAPHEAFAEPWQTVDAVTADPGVIARITVDEGAAIEPGQVLLELDTRALEAALAIAVLRRDSSAALASAQAQERMHRERVSKLSRLNSEGHARQEELARARSELEVASASLLSAREQQKVNALEAQRIEIQIDRARIKAPFRGVVTRVNKQVGELAAGGADILLVLVQLDPLRLLLHLPTTSALPLRSGQELPVACGEARISGVVDRISPVTDADSGTVRVRIRLDNAKGALRSGVRCVVTLPDSPSPSTPKQPRT